jgi:hypothetical protein
MKSTIIDEQNDRNLKKATIDSSYMAYKMRKREISPIVAGNTSKLQTSTNLNAKAELHRTQFKSTVSPNKDVIKMKVDKQLDYKKVLGTKSIMNLPIKFLSEALKTKTLTAFPSSDRYTKTKKK